MAQQIENDKRKSFGFILYISNPFKPLLQNIPRTKDFMASEHPQPKLVLYTASQCLYSESVSVCGSEELFQ